MTIDDDWLPVTIGNNRLTVICRSATGDDRYTQHNRRRSDALRHRTVLFSGEEVTRDGRKALQQFLHQIEKAFPPPDLSDTAVPRPPVERLRRRIAGKDIQPHGRDALRAQRSLELPEESAAKPRPLERGSHAKAVQHTERNLGSAPAARRIGRITAVVHRIESSRHAVEQHEPQLPAPNILVEAGPVGVLFVPLVDTRTAQGRDDLRDHSADGVEIGRGGGPDHEPGRGSGRSRTAGSGPVFGIGDRMSLGTFHRADPGANRPPAPGPTFGGCLRSRFGAVFARGLGTQLGPAVQMLFALFHRQDF